MDQRNTKQAEELQDKCVDIAPDIFKDLVKMKQPAKERSSRAQIKESKQAPETLVLSIEDDEEAPWTLELVKPLNSRDELAVKLDKDVINNVIKYLQHAGFSSDLQDVNKKRKGMYPDTPHGIWQRKNAKTGNYCYLAKAQNNKMKSCRTLADAVMVLENAKTHGYHEDEYPEEASHAGDEGAKAHGYHEDEAPEEASDAGDEA